MHFFDDFDPKNSKNWKKKWIFWFLHNIGPLAIATMCFLTLYEVLMACMSYLYTVDAKIRIFLFLVPVPLFGPNFGLCHFFMSSLLFHFHRLQNHISIATFCWLLIKCAPDPLFLPTVHSGQAGTHFGKPNVSQNYIFVYFVEI